MGVKVKRRMKQKRTPCNSHRIYSHQDGLTRWIPALWYRRVASFTPLQQQHSPVLASLPGHTAFGPAALLLALYVTVRRSKSWILTLGKGLDQGSPALPTASGQPTPLTVMSLHILQRPTLLASDREGVPCCAVRARPTVHFGSPDLRLCTKASPASQPPQVQDEFTWAAIPISPQLMLPSAN